MNIVEVTVTTTLAEQQKYYMELNDAQLQELRDFLFWMSTPFRKINLPPDLPNFFKDGVEIRQAIAAAIYDHEQKSGEVNPVSYSPVYVGHPPEHIVANGKISALDKGDEVEYTITYQADDEQHRSDVS